MARLQNNYLWFMVTLILLSLEAIEPNDTICPIGFRVAYKKNSEEDPICYRQKGPEAFGDKFKDCIGNLFTLDLYADLNITKPKLVFWTDYKSSYAGGQFVDWSFTQKSITPLPKDKVYGAVSDYDELCLVMHPETNLTAKGCEEKHDRYCFVKPYKTDPSSEGCESLEQSLRFWSPISTCLTYVITNRGNWQQSRKFCEERDGSLLYEGWRYSNNLLLLNGTPASSKDFPLSVLSSSPIVGLQRFISENNVSNISYSDWKFENIIALVEFNREIAYGSVKEDLLYYVRPSKTFDRVICEKPVELEKVTFSINVSSGRTISLSVNVILDKKDIRCFTDSIAYNMKRVSSVKKKSEYLFEFSANKNGYYWCMHNDIKHFYPSESEHILYINEKQLNKEELLNLYAVKIWFHEPYDIENVQILHSIWRKSLEQYIFFMSEYLKIYGQSLGGTKPTEMELKDFQNEHSELETAENSKFLKFQVKQIYLNETTALFHVQLNENMKLVDSGTWGNMEVVSMKPAYYCGPTKMLNDRKPLGGTVRNGCIVYKCVGDFNFGVQWIETDNQCSTSSTTPSNRQVTHNSPTVDPLQDLLQIRKNNSESSEESGEYSEAELPTTMEYTMETNLTATVTVVDPPTPKPTWPPRPPTIIIPTTEVPTTTEIPTTTEQPPISLDDAIANLEALINETTIFVHNITEAFEQVNHVLSEDHDDQPIPSQLLHLLDTLGGRIDLNGSHEERAVRGNIALLVTDAGPNHPVRGLRITSDSSELFQEANFEIINETINDSDLMADSNDLVVNLPPSVTESSRRISFVVFRNDRAFHNTHGLYMVNSRVLSVNVENLTEFNNGEVIDIHLSPNRGIPEVNESRACGFWEFADNETGQWSQRGCTFIPARRPGLLDTCRCNHLTHFAEILIPSNFSQIHKDILEVISIVGCVLSIFGLAFVGITAILFRSWRRDFSNKIWLQLCIAIFLLSLCFVIIAFVSFNKFDVICMLLGVVLHYSVLASFCWMLVAAILSYRRLVMVFTRDASHKLLRAAAFAWGLPCAIVGILLSADPQSYHRRLGEKTPSALFCYPTGLAMWLAVYAPIAIMLLVNWTLFVFIVRSVFASTRIQRHGDSNEGLRCASVSCLLVFLFGLPWVFGLFADHVVPAYFFTIMGTFQGFVLFMFFVVGNKKTRDLWLNKLKIKQTRKIPVTSSTFTNRSTGQSRPPGPASMEVKFSKPRSLASPDDSRFS